MEETKHAGTALQFLSSSHFQGLFGWLFGYRFFCFFASRILFVLVLSNNDMMLSFLFSYLFLGFWEFCGLVFIILFFILEQIGDSPCFLYQYAIVPIMTTTIKHSTVTYNSYLMDPGIGTLDKHSRILTRNRHGRYIHMLVYIRSGTEYQGLIDIAQRLGSSKDVVQWKTSIERKLTFVCLVLWWNKNWVSKYAT